MIYNFASAVKYIKPLTLINSWNKLLINEEIESDTTELETNDFHNIFLLKFSYTDKYDLGYHISGYIKIKQTLMSFLSQNLMKLKII